MKRRISMVIMATVLVGMLAFSVYAASASASSTGAHATVSTSTVSDLLADASMANLLGWASDSDEGQLTYAHAYVEYDELEDYTTYPATSSRASAWIGDTEVAYDSWRG